jgi:hypothetical protein
MNTTCRHPRERQHRKGYNLSAVDTDPGTVSQTYALCARAITQAHVAKGNSITALAIDSGPITGYSELGERTASVLIGR